MPRWFALLALVGCVTEQGIQDRWDAWVEDHGACEVPEDCAVVYPGCPLGCYEAVAAEHAAEAEEVADRLIRRYELGGRACAYDCVEAPPLTCDAGTCGFADP